MTVNDTGLALLPEKYRFQVIQIVVLVITNILKREYSAENWTDEKSWRQLKSQENTVEDGLEWFMGIKGYVELTNGIGGYDTRNGYRA